MRIYPTDLTGSQWAKVEKVFETFIESNFKCPVLHYRKRDTVANASKRISQVAISLLLLP